MMHNVFDLTINLEQFNCGRNSRTESHYLFTSRKAMSICSKDAVFALLSSMPRITDLITISSEKSTRLGISCRGPSDFIHLDPGMLLYPDGVTING